MSGRDYSLLRMAAIEAADLCPYVRRSAIHECRAHSVVSFEAEDSRGQALPPTLTCAWLAVGSERGGVYYPRCGIGDAAARAEYVEHRDRQMESSVEPAVAGAEEGTGFPEAGVLVANDEGRYIAVNDRICRLLRMERSTLLRKSVWDLTPEVHADVGHRMWREFIESGEQYGSYQLLCGDGKVRSFDFMARAKVAPGVHVSILTPA